MKMIEVKTWKKSEIGIVVAVLYDITIANPRYQPAFGKDFAFIH